MKKYINIVVFWGFIYLLFCSYGLKIGKQAASTILFSSGSSSSKIEQINSQFQQADVYQRDWINLYGFAQRILSKNQIENFTLFKTSYGKIVSPQPAETEEAIKTAVDNVDAVAQYLREKEIPFFYLTNILPIPNSQILPDGITDYSSSNAQLLLDGISGRGIPIIDLRTSRFMQDIPQEQRFYRTDHHWSLQSCFEAFREIIFTANKELGWNLDPKNQYTNLERYIPYVKKHSFLGSYGVKAGEYYAGMDDFLIYLPNFPTNLRFESYRDTQLLLNKEGPFEEALIDWSLIENDSYYNKYNAFLYTSSVENRIVNQTADNNKKLLLISHSYGRSLAQYLSLCFNEVRHLDPQEGRYNDNYLAYIDTYEPDLVLMLTESEGLYFPVTIE